MRTGIRIRDIMTKNPIICKTTDSILDCAKLMKKYEIGSLIVSENGTVLGIVTEQDFTRKVVALNLNLNDAIKTVMEKNVIHISSESDIEDAITIMADNGIKHLPVIDKNKLVGFITAKDVLKIQPDLIALLVDRIRMNNEDYRINDDMGGYKNKKKFPF